MNLQGNNDKDKIVRKARFVIGYSGQWQLMGTVYEETQGKDKQSLADARVRIQGIADISEDEEGYYPEKEDKFILSDGTGSFSLDCEGISGQIVVVASGKEGYKNGGTKVTLGQGKNRSVILSPCPEKDQSSY